MCAHLYTHVCASPHSHACPPTHSHAHLHILLCVHTYILTCTPTHSHTLQILLKTLLCQQVIRPSMFLLGWNHSKMHWRLPKSIGPLKWAGIGCRERAQAICLLIFNLKRDWELKERAKTSLKEDFRLQGNELSVPFERWECYTNFRASE